ncbi:NAD(P)-dependent oxidoreductase [Arthrobacter sp. Soil764]|uniref:NAD(P)-dependent oxidoreductase n=1 Tax=Arthrobacter sp. Soil764 TaxID=1736403 RepID=UPI0006F87BBE|nr:NAD(P)-dependent oxidoreductase [Arthrobacter sp. Soil764]KRE81451.1 phosphoglycerate dehydrogenase [Arthrobacter sp. Soil764]
MSTVVVTEDVTGPAYDQLGREWTLQRDVNAWDNPGSWPALLQNAEAVIVRNRTQVNEQFFAAAPNLKVVARAGVGLDNIDLEAANRAGVVIVAPLGANAVSVAEHTLTLALALAKNLVTSDTETKGGSWNRVPTQELGGKTWGLLSAGATARATARVAKAFGMTVLAYDPYVDPNHPELQDLGIQLASLEEVLAASNVLSVHLPHTDATHHLLNSTRLSSLPPGALVISVGRGEVIDEQALLGLLESGHLGGAGLDVREQEPPRPGALESHSRVLLTPHVAGISVQAQARIADVLCQQVRLVLRGDTATSAVGEHVKAKRPVRQ